MDEMNFYINWMTMKNRQMEAQNKAEMARMVRAIKAAQPRTLSIMRSMVKRISTWMQAQTTEATFNSGCGCGCCAVAGS